MIARARWALDSLLFAIVVVTALSSSNQVMSGPVSPGILALDVVGGILFLALPLLLSAAIRFNWLYRDRQGNTGHVGSRSYFGKTAVMSAMTVSAIHMFAPSRTLLMAIGIALALTVGLTVVSPVRVTRRETRLMIL